MREREEAEELKRLEEKWNPWLGKAMQHEEQEKKKAEQQKQAETASPINEETKA